jgi:hypothetical protein
LARRRGVSAHRAICETVYRDSTRTIDRPDVDANPEDAAHPAGPHKVDTLIFAVVTRRDGMWRIQAA